MVRALVVLVMASLAPACGEDAPWVQDARPPRVDGVSPNERTAGTGGDTAILGRYLKPAYNAWSDDVTPVRAFVDDREVTVLEADAGGSRLRVELPDDLAAGLHNVRVENRFGTDTLENAYLVVGP
ncbi:MAG: hypothetical protein HY904_10410 [Deltaproteobacteria bacterium]|nr:hypothetical protein [Deltaproteobacteria bacterium]